LETSGIEGKKRGLGAGRKKERQLNRSWLGNSYGTEEGVKETISNKRGESQIIEGKLNQDQDEGENHFGEMRGSEEEGVEDGIKLIMYRLKRSM